MKTDILIVEYHASCPSANQLGENFEMFHY